MSLSQTEQYLEEEVQRLEGLLQQRSAQLVHARETVEHLEDVIHKASKIASHLPYLCESLPEPSAELLQAALQLQTLLVQRRT